MREQRNFTETQPNSRAKPQDLDFKYRRAKTARQTSSNGDPVDCSFWFIYQRTSTIRQQHNFLQSYLSQVAAR